MKRYLKPTAGHLVIVPEEIDNKIGQFDLAEGQSQKPLMGRVEAVGNDQIHESGDYIPSPAEEGDLVVYRKFGDQEVMLEGVTYKIIRFTDIVAVVGSIDSSEEASDELPF